MRNLVGAKSFLALRDDLMRERLSFRDLWEPPEGVKRNYGKQRAAAKRRGDAILRKHGMSREKLRKIGRDADAKLNALLALDDASIVSGYNLKNNLSRWTKLSRLNTLPLPWINDLPEPDPTDPNRWFLFRPPFFGFLFSDDYVTSTNFDAGSMLHLHPPSGLVGVEASMDCNDASSFDFASVAVESQIAVAFDPPKAGVIEVLIDAQCTVGTHSVKIKDEFGFSSGWCNQNNYLMMNVLHPNVPEASLALMSNLFEETDGDDLSENRENLTRGQHYFAQLFSSGPVPAGQRVFVTAGTRTFDKARANDMTVESRTNLQWFISSLQVRISP
ncbi:MAG TPA: hypothetical protein VM939_15250 [Gemmatimonadaceae bacterium]|nr:hypothetical protein [Gemmatimonadaceae bacterium]